MGETLINSSNRVREPNLRNRTRVMGSLQRDIFINQLNFEYNQFKTDESETEKNTNDKNS